MEKTSYIIRGGVQGRERLRILSRVMQPTTLALLARAGLREGMSCLEIGCGGGDLAMDMARIVGPGGKVLGTDIDQIKVDIATKEARENNVTNLEFRFSDISKTCEPGEFDLVHARFVLTHLPKPEAALARMKQCLRPGGLIVVEDIDFRGYMCHPDSPALWRYVELYTKTAQRKGVDPNIGPRLPSMLSAAGFENVQMNVVQPAGTTGEVKLISPLTMENIAETVVEERLATTAEIDQIVAELYHYAKTPGTIGSAPRIIEAWASQP